MSRSKKCECPPCPPGCPPCETACACEEFDPWTLGIEGRRVPQPSAGSEVALGAGISPGRGPEPIVAGGPMLVAGESVAAYEERVRRGAARATGSAPAERLPWESGTPSLMGASRLRTQITGGDGPPPGLYGERGRGRGVARVLLLGAAGGGPGLLARGADAPPGMPQGLSTQAIRPLARAEGERPPVDPHLRGSDAESRQIGSRIESRNDLPATRAMPSGGPKAAAADARAVAARLGPDTSRSAVEGVRERLRREGAVSPEASDLAIVQVLSGAKSADLRARNADPLADGAWNAAGAKGAETMVGASKAAHDRLTTTRLEEFRGREDAKAMAARTRPAVAPAGTAPGPAAGPVASDFGLGGGAPASSAPTPPSASGFGVGGPSVAVSPAGGATAAAGPAPDVLRAERPDLVPWTPRSPATGTASTPDAAAPAVKTESDRGPEWTPRLAAQDGAPVSPAPGGGAGKPSDPAGGAAERLLGRGPSPFDLARDVPRGKSGGDTLAGSAAALAGSQVIGALGPGNGRLDVQVLRASGTFPAISREIRGWEQIAVAAGRSAHERFRRDVLRLLTAAIHDEQKRAWKARGKTPPRPNRRSAEKDAAALVDALFARPAEVPPDSRPDGRPAAGGDTDCPCPCRPATKGGDGSGPGSADTATRGTVAHTLADAPPLGPTLRASPVASAPGPHVVRTPDERWPHAIDLSAQHPRGGVAPDPTQPPFVIRPGEEPLPAATRSLRTELMWSPGSAKAPPAGAAGGGAPPSRIDAGPAETAEPDEEDLIDSVIRELWRHFDEILERRLGRRLSDGERRRVHAAAARLFRTLALLALARVRLLEAAADPRLRSLRDPDGELARKRAADALEMASVDAAFALTRFEILQRAGEALTAQSFREIPAEDDPRRAALRNELHGRIPSLDDARELWSQSAMSDAAGEDYPYPSMSDPGRPDWRQIAAQNPAFRELLPRLFNPLRADAEIPRSDLDLLRGVELADRRTRAQQTAHRDRSIRRWWSSLTATDIAVGVGSAVALTVLTGGAYALAGAAWGTAAGLLAAGAAATAGGAGSSLLRQWLSPDWDPERGADWGAVRDEALLSGLLGMVAAPLSGVRPAPPAGARGALAAYEQAIDRVAAGASGRASVQVPVQAGEAAAGAAPRRVTQFFKPKAGGLGEGGEELLAAQPEIGPIGRLIEGEWDQPITWVSPRSVSEQTWFSRFMTGVGLRRHAVEFDVFPGELVAPRGLKAVVGPYQQAIPGTVSLAGRNPTFVVLDPNYVGYVATGTVYAGYTAAAAYGAYKAYQAISPDSSSATDQSPRPR